MTRINPPAATHPHSTADNSTLPPNTSGGQIVALAVRLLSRLRSRLRGFFAAVRDFIGGEYEAEVVSRRTGKRELRERERERKAVLLADLDRRRLEIIAS